MSSLEALAPATPGAPVQDWDFRTARRAFVAHHKLFFGVFGALAAITLIFAFVLPKTYVTQAHLIVGNPNTPSSSNSNNALLTNFPVLNALLQSGSQSAETYAELIQETSVAQSVIDKLQLRTTVPSLLAHVSVKPVTNTSILELSAAWRDRQVSANIANEFGRALITRARSLISGQADTAIAFLSQQMPSSAARLGAAEGALARFEARTHTSDINLQTQNTLNALAGLDSKIGQVQLDRSQAQAQLSSVDAQLRGLTIAAPGATTVAPNPVLGQLQTQLAQVETQLRTARAQYTDQHPAVKALLTQQASLQREIASQPATVVSSQSTQPNPVYQQLSQAAATYSAQIAGDGAQLSELKKQRVRMGPQMRNLPYRTAQLFQLQRAAKLAEGLYTALQQKYNDALITKSTVLSDVTITQAATPETAIARPNTLLSLVIGLLISLCAAVGVVFAMDFFDQRIRGAEEVELNPWLPVLSSVPDVGTLDNPASPWVRAVAAESFLELSTSLRAIENRSPRLIAVTSPTVGDGKTTVALNLAIAISEIQTARIAPPMRRAALPEKAGGVGWLLDMAFGRPRTALALREPSSEKNGTAKRRRVLLVDGDLRRGTLHERLDVSNECGLSDVLEGQASLWDAICRTKHEDLDVMPRGTTCGNPLKSLQSPELDAAVKQCLGVYDAVVFDSPPMLAVLDSTLIASKADATVVVVSAGITKRGDLRESLQRWERLGVRKIGGIVVNRTEPRVQQSGYYDDGSYFEVDPFARPKAEVTNPA